MPWLSNRYQFRFDWVLNLLVWSYVWYHCYWASTCINYSINYQEIFIVSTSSPFYSISLCLCFGLDYNLNKDINILKFKIFKLSKQLCGIVVNPDAPIKFDPALRQNNLNSTTRVQPICIWLLMKHLNLQCNYRLLYMNSHLFTIDITLAIPN